MMNPNIKYLELKEFEKYIGTDHKLDMELIKNVCRNLKINFYGGGTIFFEGHELQTNLEDFDKYLSSQVRLDRQYVVAYEKVLRQHPKYTYYKLIAILSNNEIDLKTIFKFQNLKAFL